MNKATVFNAVVCAFEYLLKMVKKPFGYVDALAVVNAQNNVTGSVTGNDGLPVIQATVTLQQKCDSVKELRVVTDNDGKFMPVLRFGI